MNKELYEAMKELAIAKMDEANNWLEREDVTREFETLEEHREWKSTRKDAEIKYAIFAELLHDIKEAEEFEDYEDCVGVVK